jgi:CRISPR/Cas system-associated exonuclease Cas4 (RecB family)
MIRYLISIASVAQIFPSIPDAPKSVPTEIVLLLLILGLIIFMWDLFERRSSSIRKEAGLEEKTELISLRGGTCLPSKECFSPSLGLTSKPDALIKEEGYVIPVDVKPMTNKVRDRHVIALFAHMRLIEETEGKRPPYGILLMGEKRRRVKIKNSEEKQRWLDALLEEMRSICDGVPAVPAPSTYKCRSCDVHGICKYSMA